jgi:hypothetical protein
MSYVNYKKTYIFFNIATDLGGRGSDFNDWNLADRLPDTVQPVSRKHAEIYIRIFFFKQMHVILPDFLEFPLNSLQ